MHFFLNNNRFRYIPCQMWLFSKNVQPHVFGTKFLCTVLTIDLNFKRRYEKQQLTFLQELFFSFFLSTVANFKGLKILNSALREKILRTGNP